MSAFLLFSEDIRDVVEKEQPNLKPHQIARELGKRWDAAGPQVQEVSSTRIHSTYGQTLHSRIAFC